MTESFELRRRTPAGQLRYLAQKLAGVHAQDSAQQTTLTAVQLQLEQVADTLDSGTIPATPICGDVFQSGITDRAQGPCLKPPGHSPADPWHQDNTGCRWRPTEDAPDGFRWHVLSECEDEAACPIHGRDTSEPTGPEDLPELTAEDAVEAMQDMAGDLYRAEDRLAFVREMCDLADRNGEQVTTEQVRAWTQYTGCGGVIELSEQQECPLPPSACEARACNQLAPAGAEDALDPGEVHQQAGGFNGADAWMWRCNGTQWCDGWIGLDLSSEQAAQAEYERHARECHSEQPTEQQLHARRACPGWEYDTTEGPRKQWDDVDRPPSDQNGDPDPSWERNVDAGRDGWERFDYTEESYWRRRVGEQP